MFTLIGFDGGFVEEAIGKSLGGHSGANQDNQLQDFLVDSSA